MRFFLVDRSFGTLFDGAMVLQMGSSPDPFISFSFYFHIIWRMRLPIWYWFEQGIFVCALIIIFEHKAMRLLCTWDTGIVILKRIQQQDTFYTMVEVYLCLLCAVFSLLSQQKLIKLRNKYVNALIPVSNIYIYSFNSCFLLCCFYLILPLDSYHTHQYYIILYDSMHNLDAMPHFGNFLQKGLPI